jgi:uncharacterized protein (TIGR03437 family)
LLSHAPLRFEPESGQRYVARGVDYRLALTRSGIELGSGVRMQLAGANPRARIEPLDPLPSRTNYLVGSDASRWRSGVPNYGRLRLRDIYPGIDLILYGSKGSLEFDFDVAPGASADAIRMDIRGARHTRVEDGALILDTGAGEVRWGQPVIYQQEGATRRNIEGRFVLGKHGRVQFALNAYDRTLPLVIDPVLSFSTYFGNTNNEAARGIGIDKAGNIYIAGYTTSRNLPVSASAVQASYGGNTTAYQTGDAFVAKFSAAGVLQAMTYLGGARDDFGSGLAVDANGNVYVTGYTNSLDFPVTSKAYQQKMAGSGGNALFTVGDAFVTKLNSGLSQIIYSTYLGGSRDEAGISIAIDAAGNAYVTGITLSTNFPVTTGAAQSVFHGSSGQPVTDFGVPFFVTGDAFVTKLNTDGSQLMYSTYLGGSADDAPSAIAVDAAGNAYVGGFTISRDFPTTANALQTSYKGAEAQNDFYHLGDGFITKLNPTGTAFVYSTYLGGRGDDAVSALAVDASGSVYATGATTSPDFPVTAGVVQTVNAGPLILPFAERIVGDAFVAKLKPDGTGLVYATFLGGSGDDAGQAIAVDSGGNAYVGGSTASTNFPVTADAQQKSLAGSGGEHGNNDLIGDGFLTILNPTGTSAVFSTHLGGSLDDSIQGLALDPSGDILVTGVTMSSNFPVSTGAYQSKYGGTGTVGRINGDAFLARFSGPVFGTLTAAPASITVNYPGGGVKLDPAAVNITGSVPISFTVTTSNASWLKVTPSTGNTPASLTVVIDPTGLAAGTYNATINIAAVGPGVAALAIPVTLTVPSVQVAPAFTGDGVLNAASMLAGPVSPGEVVLFTGSNMGPAARVDADPSGSGSLSTTLAGTMVLFGTVGAPLNYTSAGQVSAIVPYGVAGQDSVTAQVVFNGVSSNPVSLQVTDSSPALFTVNQQGTGQAVALNEDGSPNSDDNPATIGSVIQLSGTGEGLIDPPIADGTLATADAPSTPVLNVSATIDGQPAVVQSAGTTPGSAAGFLQLRIVVPDGVSSGDVQVVVTIGNNSSPPNVTVAIQ